VFERAGEGLEKRRMRGQKKKRWKGKRILVLGVVGDDHLPRNREREGPISYLPESRDEEPKIGQERESEAELTRINFFPLMIGIQQAGSVACAAVNGKEEQDQLRVPSGY